MENELKLDGDGIDDSSVLVIIFGVCTLIAILSGAFKLYFMFFT